MERLNRVNMQKRKMILIVMKMEIKSKTNQRLRTYQIYPLKALAISGVVQGQVAMQISRKTQLNEHIY